MDISEISNSPKFSCRQKVSDGSDFVWMSSTPSTSTSPVKSGATRSLLPQMMLSSSFFAINCSRAFSGGTLVLAPGSAAIIVRPDQAKAAFAGPSTATDKMASMGVEAGMFYLAQRRALVPRDQWTTTLDTHLAWMKAQHEAGTILLSGPNPDRKLGMYLIRAANRGEAERVAAGD